jgi:anthranilate phosphoribosyltransferase
MAISQYIKKSVAARAAQTADAWRAADLFGQVLDGSVTDLEIGAFCLAMRIKGETPRRCAAFWTRRTSGWPLPATSRPTIVLPSYNGARKLPVLTPLLALLLAREGLPVLLHGMRTEARRILASDVLEALDIKALAAPETIANGQVAHIHTQHLHPAWRACWPCAGGGPAQPGHSVVKLMNPCAGQPWSSRPTPAVPGHAARHIHQHGDDCPALARAGGRSGHRPAPHAPL